MDLRLSGKKAIVLGGSRGIGWCTAQLLQTLPIWLPTAVR